MLIAKPYVVVFRMRNGDLLEDKVLAYDPTEAIHSACIRKSKQAADVDAVVDIRPDEEELARRTEIAQAALGIDFARTLRDMIRMAAPEKKETP